MASDLLKIEQPIIDVLERDGEYYQIKVSFPLKNEKGSVVRRRAGIIQFTPENFPVHYPLADIVKIKFETGYTEGERK